MKLKTRIMAKEKVARRLGFIETDKAIHVSHIDQYKWLFKHVTPIDVVDIKDHFQRPMQKWLCYSEEFREIEEGGIIPEYEVSFKFERKGESTITVESIEIKEIIK